MALGTNEGMPPDLTTAEGQAMALIFLMRRRRRKYLAQKKRIWMRQALKRQAERSAELLGPELKLVTELQQPDEDDRFQKHYSLSREQFEALLTLTAPRIDKAAAATALVKPIPAKESLAICLRFLATGDSYGSIAASFNVGDAVVAKLVPRVCKAIWSSLKDTFLPASNASDWLEVAKGFHERWDFPNCVGALDGKHIMVKASPPLPAAVASSAAAAASDAAEGDVEAAQGHVMESPKRKPSPASSSITVLAVADAFSCFRMIEVCPFGRKSDRGMFAASEFGKALHEGKLGLPEDAPLPGVASDLGPMPHVFISGESFPLKRNMMRPFPKRDLSFRQRNFNQRISMARRVVENAFGIMTSNWRIYHRVIDVCPDTAGLIVKATVALHNFQRSRQVAAASQCEDQVPEDQVLVDTNCPGMQDLSRVGANNASFEAISVRENFCTYLESKEGHVAFFDSTSQIDI